ncbi:MAG: triose-phosphate isomerase [Clostridia bacterium]|nr:triose-phosphate isomerase [Clostridia bacterium]
MRTPIIAGNWKMNKTPAEAKALAEALIPLVKNAPCTVVLCTPAVDFAAVSEAIGGANIKLGAQNMHWQPGGAYTGELSADMLLAAGCAYVILGHSERRQYFAETDESVNRKTLAAVRAGLIPIVCVGETRSQREEGYTDTLVAYQTLTALTGLTAAQVAQVVIAYEPVWAIGTGLTATDEEANDTVGVIRAAIRRQYGDAAAGAVRIQYGGSMNPANAGGLMRQPEIDGGLIGGASLKAADFAKVVHFENGKWKMESGK